MSLNFSISITNRRLADSFGLDPDRKYEVDMMDHESFFIRHPQTGEKVEIKFQYAEEHRPQY